MKKILISFLATFLLTGCAKIYEEDIPCTGSKPSAPVVGDVVVSPGNSIIVFPSTNPQGNTRWVSPTGIVTNSSALQLDMSYDTIGKYGKYTVYDIVNGCASLPGTFLVSPYQTGSPTCTISTNNRLVGSNGTSFTFTSPGYQTSMYCSNYLTGFTNVSTSGYTLELYTPSTPQPGYVYDLTSSCYNIYPDKVYVAFTGNGTTYYQSVSGKVYCNVINGVKYMTFCGATFRRVSTGSSFTLTGNVSWY